MNELILQAGAGCIEGSMDIRLGIIAVKAKTYAPDIITAITAPSPDIGIVIPEWRPRTFTSRPEGDGYDVTHTFEGHTGLGEGEEYALEGGFGENPIEAHPDFLILKELYGGKTDPVTGRALWPETFGKDADHNPMHGVDCYRMASMIWTHKWVSQSLSRVSARTLATIQPPPGNPPKLNGARNWLKIRVRAVQRGNIWQIEESWESSGPYGWVPEMYQYHS